MAALEDNKNCYQIGNDSRRCKIELEKFNFKIFWYCGAIKESFHWGGGGGGYTLRLERVNESGDVNIMVRHLTVTIIFNFNCRYCLRSR